VRSISELLKKGVRNADFPGAAYAIVLKDGKIDSDQVGYRQLLPEKIPVDGKEIYDAASLTKVVATTTMIMKLIESGRLAWDTKVGDIIPRFRHPLVTIQELLTHSSGLPADISGARNLKSREDVLERLFQYELSYPSGSKVIYSDLGFILLGLVIEKITGSSLAEYAHKAIFGPLGMKDTSYHPDPERTAPTEYRDDLAYRGWLRGLVHDEKAFAMGQEAGHAGMFTTTSDISRFILSILRNDGIILLPETVDLLFLPRIRYAPEEGVVLIRSLGWDKPVQGGSAGDMYDFADTIIHTGFTGCNLWIDRFHGIGFIMLSNAVHPRRELNNIIKYRNTISNLAITYKGGIGS